MPKIALFYDWLNQDGGAEKVLLSLIKLYPQAPIFTLVHQPQKTTWLPKNTKIITSFINQLPFSQNNPLFYTPFYDLALEQFDFSQYDIIISTTSVVGHCLLTLPSTLFVCYYHNLNRYLYSTPKRYSFLRPLLNIYKKFDYIYSRRPDYSLCNSQTVHQRLKKQFNLDIPIINPGVNTEFFKPINNPDNNFFLIVSRLVPHKNFDIVIKAFNSLPYRLIVIGTGREFSHLQSLAKNNPRIKFLGYISDRQKLKYYQNCQALICPQLEDFGITPIEAQACGKPVIALGHGGNTETIVNHQTGIFFDKPTVTHLKKAIQEFLSIKFNPTKCRQNSLKFSESSFMLNFKKTIDHLWLTR